MDHNGEGKKDQIPHPDRGDAAGHRCFPLDRSKVRILLCDKDAKSSEEVLELLHRCSYQVTSARTARQVIEVLNAQGPDIDIILAEVDLPIAKGMKMLKYIMRDKDMRRIPIIMMSAQDEVSVVVKCLRLGAADYLVKPLRTNELLNLWTHMWRRRRMLGLAEKDVLGHDLELVLSEPSDANTNSTNLLSDDTEDKPSRATYTERDVSNHHECESNAFALESAHPTLLANEPNIRKDVDRTVFSGGMFSCPKKTDLKVGESSAFLTYVKSSAPTGNSKVCRVDGNAAPSETLNCEGNPLAGGDTDENGFVTSRNVCDPNTFPMAMEFPVVCLSSSEAHPQSRNEVPIDIPGVPPIFHLPIYVPGMERNIVPSSVQMFQGSLNDAQVHTTPSPQYNVLSQCPYVPMMPSFSYHPAGMPLQSGQISSPHLWSSVKSTTTPELKSGLTERRAAALIKFRQKRKDRCFDKKIRYVNRKRLAEKRPRVRGQFVRQLNGVDVHLNGFPSVSGDSEKDEDEEHCSPEHNAAASRCCK